MAQIRIELRGRNEFWSKAILVEWAYQYPDRPLQHLQEAYYLIEAAWLVDLERVAQQCFGRALVAPLDPGRRTLFRRLFTGNSVARD